MKLRAVILTLALVLLFGVGTQVGLTQDEADSDTSSSSNLTRALLPLIMDLRPFSYLDPLGLDENVQYAIDYSTQATVHDRYSHPNQHARKWFDLTEYGRGVCHSDDAVINIRVNRSDGSHTYLRNWEGDESPAANWNWTVGGDAAIAVIDGLTQDGQSDMANTVRSLMDRSSGCPAQSSSFHCEHRP